MKVGVEGGGGESKERNFKGEGVVEIRVVAGTLRFFRRKEKGCGAEPWLALWTGPPCICLLRRHQFKNGESHHSGGFYLPYGASVYKSRITSSEALLRESVVV